MGLFHNTGSSSSGADDFACPALPTPLYATEPINGALTFQKLAEYIAGISTAVTIAITFVLIFLHASHCSRPAEQIKIIRVVAALPVFALISFGTIFLGESAIYLSPWSNAFEAIAILSIFQLLFAYWQRERSLRDGIGMSMMDYENNKPEPLVLRDAANEADASISPQSVKRTKLMVAQYIGAAIVVAAASDITQAIGRYCKGSSSPKHAALWMAIIRTISVSLAVVGVLRFNKTVSPMIRSYKATSKIFGFKAIVALNVIQNLVFGFIGGHFTPSNTFAYYDLTVALAGLLSCCEMVIFALVFHAIYRSTPYNQRYDSRSGKQMGTLSALLEAFSPISLIKDAIHIGSE